jgi:hypothetical protein
MDENKKQKKLTFFCGVCFILSRNENNQNKRLFMKILRYFAKCSLFRLLRVCIASKIDVPTFFKETESNIYIKLILS